MSLPVVRLMGTKTMESFAHKRFSGPCGTLNTAELVKDFRRDDQQRLRNQVEQAVKADLKKI